MRISNWSSDVCSSDLHGCVGLCHGAGSWDAARSIPPHLLAPICAMAPCISLMPEPTTLPVLNPDGCPFDMKATAALVAATELVISSEERRVGQEGVLMV